MEAEEPTTMMTDEVMTEQQPELPTAEAAAVAMEETAADDAPPARLMITKMVRWLPPLIFILMTRPLPFIPNVSLPLSLLVNLTSLSRSQPQ